LLIIKIKDKN